MTGFVVQGYIYYIILYYFNMFISNVGLFWAPAPRGKPVYNVKNDNKF